MTLGRINPASLASVLRMTGGNPDLADSWGDMGAELHASTPVPAPEPSVIPPNANEALAATGSAYRVPSAPEPAPAAPAPAPAEAPRAAPVEPAPYDPNVNTAGLRKQLAGGQNEQLDAVTAQGDTRSEQARKSAEVLAELKGKRETSTAEMEKRIGKDRESRAVSDAAARARLDKVQEMIDHPPDASKGAVMRAIGAFLSMSPTGNGAGIGAGLQMLGQNMAGDIGAWRQQIAAQQQGVEGELGMSNNSRQNIEHETRTEKALGEIAFANTDLALKQFEQEAKTETERDAARQLRGELLSKFAGADLAKSEAKDAAAAKAAAAAGRSKAEDAMLKDIILKGGSTPASRLAYAIGQHGEKGRKVIDSLQKTDKAMEDIQATMAGTKATEAGIDATRAKTKKDENEGGPQEVIPGYFTTMTLKDNDVTDLRKNGRAMASIVEDLRQLRAIRTRNNKGGSWNPTDVAIADGILARMPGKFSNMSGSGAPSEPERKAFDAITANPTDYYARKDPVEIYDQMAQGLQSSFDATLDIMGVKRPPKPSTAPGVAQQTEEVAGATPDAPVRRMVWVNKNGRSEQIDSRFVDEAVNTRGFQLGKAAAPAPAAMASATDEDYEAQVRREQGY